MFRNITIRENKRFLASKIIDLRSYINETKLDDRSLYYNPPKEVIVTPYDDITYIGKGAYIEKDINGNEIRHCGDTIVTTNGSDRFHTVKYFGYFNEKH